MLLAAGAARRHPLILGALLGAIIFIAALEPLHDLAGRAFAAADPAIQRHPIWGAGVFVALAALSAMLAFFSSSVLVPVAVHTWGAGGALALLWLGWLLGGVASYTIGRVLGRPVVRHFVSAERISYYEKRIGDRAPFLLILLFQAALPSEIPGYVLGILRYPLPGYLAALALAELPYAVGAAALGAGFLHRQYVLIAGLGVVGIGFVTWAFGRLHRVLAGGDPGAPG